MQKEKHTHVQRWQQHKSLKAGQRLSGSRVVQPFSAWLTGSEKYTRARVQKRQKLKSSFIMASLTRMDPHTRWSQGKTIEAHSPISEGTAVPTSIQSVARPVRITTENFPRRLKRPRAVVQSAYDTSCPKTAREYRRSQGWHCSSEHMIAVVALTNVNISVSPRENDCLVHDPPNIVC